MKYSFFCCNRLFFALEPFIKKSHQPETAHSDITPSTSEKRLCLEAYPIKNCIGNLYRKSRNWPLRTMNSRKFFTCHSMAQKCKKATCSRKNGLPTSYAGFMAPGWAIFGRLSNIYRTINGRLWSIMF